MNWRSAALLVGAVLALYAPLGAFAQTTDQPQAACDDPANCPTAPSPQVEVAGVQTSAEDARLPGESDEFIINDGFGD